MDSYSEGRARLLATGSPGLASAQRLASLTDAAVAELAASAGQSLGGRWAVCALGGWGAGAMFPKSDVDVLILSDSAGKDLKPFVESVLYPLWDIGLAVGHQVRSPKQHRAACRGDLETLTASLTGRVIAGGRAFGASCLDGVAGEARRRSRTVLRDVSTRARPGSAFLLEPNLKEGAGGRRDLDEMSWIAAVLSGAPRAGMHRLIEHGLVAADEVAMADAAAETLAAARWELHLAGEGDTLTLDAAGALGTPASEVQSALIVTSNMLARVRRRLRGEPFGDADAMTAGDLFALLDRGTDSLPALEEAACDGRLELLLPGARDLMALRRPGLTHTLTVGAHHLRAACLVIEQATEPGPVGTSYRALHDRRALQVAAITHDSGKTTPGTGHAERGTATAAQAARALGLDEAGARDAAELVRLHLLLAETALHDDIDDEDVVLRAARRIGRRELVAPLHVLTRVDSLATGPAGWSHWHETLVGALAARLDAALRDDVDGAGLASRGDAVRARALSIVTGPDARAFVVGAPLRYLATREAEAVVRDASLVASLPGGDGADFRMSVHPTPTAGAFALTVVARDRPELFARIAGALALAGADILAADAYPAPGDRAVDVFTVTSATLAPLDHSVWQQVERYLHAALRDRLELRTRLAQRRRHYPPKRGGASDVETRPGPFGTLVSVIAPDRPGLLHDLSDAIAGEGLDIRWAKAVTADGFARDTFSVVDRDGQPVTEHGALGHLAMRLRDVR